MRRGNVVRNDVDAIVRLFRERGSFLLACHENPEGDAIGSELALALALRKLGKRATVLNADPVPSNLRFLPGADTVVLEPDGSAHEVAVLLDCGSPDRAGRVAGELARCPFSVNIDHHRAGDPHGQLGLVDPDAAAAGVLVHRLLRAMEFPIDVDVALNLYVSILTDTGSFRYSSANPEAFRIAGEMVELGVEPWQVAEKVYETQEPHRLRLLGRVLSSLELSGDGKVAAVTTTLADLAEFGATKDMLEGFVNHPRAVEGAEVGVAFREEAPGRWRASLRSKGRVDVSGVARAFGGGGHRNAAGCTVEGDLAEAKRRLFAALGEAMR
jgi:phosphoesterase RecJ-like protein